MPLFARSDTPVFHRIFTSTRGPARKFLMTDAFSDSYVFDGMAHLHFCAARTACFSAGDDFCEQGRLFCAHDEFLLRLWWFLWRRPFNVFIKWPREFLVVEAFLSYMTRAVFSRCTGIFLAAERPAAAFLFVHQWFLRERDFCRYTAFLQIVHCFCHARFLGAAQIFFLSINFWFAFWKSERRRFYWIFDEVNFCSEWKSRFSA